VAFTYDDPIIVRMSIPGTNPSGKSGVPFSIFAWAAHVGSGTSPDASAGRSIPVGSPNPNWRRSFWSFRLLSFSWFCT
jgi:hypothetical protein